MLQIIHPINHQRPNVVADREEGGNERLGEFCLHLAGVLIDLAFGNVDVPELKRGNRAVPRAGQDRERYQRAVSALDRWSPASPE